MAGRKSRLLFRFSGVLLLRFAERAFEAGRAAEGSLTPYASLMSFLPSSTLALIVLGAFGGQAPVRTGPHAAVGPPTLYVPCPFVGASHAMSFVAGASTVNTFVTTADPDTRRFIVYVPSTYSVAHAPYPVVFMLHGTGQTAQIAMNNTTWNQAAEVLGFIAVYPQGLPYLLLDGTVRTKWHTDEVAASVVDPSELPMADDVLFLRELHNTLGAHLNIDCDRIYATGFSNGGAFVKTKIHVGLADIFAATTSSGGIGLGGGTAAQYFPANGTDFRPHFEVVGTLDDKKRDNCIAAGDLQPGDILPRHVADVLATPCMWDPLQLYTDALGLDVSAYSTLETPALTQFIWNTTVMGTGPREYRFRILPNMTHEYPSGTNYPTDYVPIFYGWLSQYTR